jgi:hypothetical protein
MTQPRKKLFHKRLTIEQRVAGVELHADFALVPCAGSCGRQEEHRVSVKQGKLLCSLCPGFQIRMTCAHVEATARAAGNCLLTIEGELSNFYTSVLEAAIADLQTGAHELCKGYLWLMWRSIETPRVCTTRYGYAPDCERPIVKIGVRFLDLSEFEKAACVHYLRLLQSKTQRQAA